MTWSYDLFMKLETRFVLPLVFFAVARGVTTAAETTSPNLEDGLARCHAMVAAHDIEAAEFCASLLNESAYTLSSEQAVDVRFNLVDALSFSGHYSVALANLLAIQSSTKQFPDNQSLEYRWYRKRGLLHYRAGELVDAYEAYSKALRLAEITEDPVLLGQSFNDMAFLNKARGRYEAALAAALESLRYKRSVGKPLAIAITMGNIADVHRALEKHDLAADFYRRGVAELNALLETPPAVGRPTDARIMATIAHLEESAAAALTASGRFPDAEQALQSALELFRNLEDGPSETRVLVNLGASYVESNQLALAEETLLMAFSQEQLREQPASIDLRKYLSKMHMLQGRLEIAETTAAMGLHLARERDQAGALPGFFNLLGQIAVRQQRFATAVQYQNEYIRLREDWLAQKYAENIRQLIAEVDLYEKNLELLRIETTSELQQGTIATQRAYLLAVVFGSLIMMACFFLLLAKRRAKQRALELEIDHHRQLFEQMSVSMPSADDDQSSEEQRRPEPSEMVRSTIVDLMTHCLDYWELTTRTGRIELAEQSRIWKVTIDEGRLRTRTLDRYLDLKKLPVRPRIRSVLQTCHYVLSECQLSESQRMTVNRKLDELLQATRDAP